MNQHIILATTSPYKIRTFAQLQIPFDAEDSHVDEKSVPRSADPAAHALKLARMKAAAAAQRHPGSIVIGLDSIAEHRGSILEKPKTREAAIARLKRLSGETHQAITGVCVRFPNGTEAVRTVSTQVTLRQLSDEEIAAYVATDPDITRICLGYDPETKRSAGFVERIDGCPHNLFNGVPLGTLAALLKTPV